jgi:hypothetical protein
VIGEKVHGVIPGRMGLSKCNHHAEYRRRASHCRVFGEKATPPERELQGSDESSNEGKKQK